MDESEDIESARAAGVEIPSWMMECVRRNPEYTSWGPEEDYMATRNAGVGSWEQPLYFSGWKKFSEDFDEVPDGYNEIVNFYFELDTLERDCPVCGGHGWNKETLKIMRETPYGPTDLTVEETDMLKGNNSFSVGDDGDHLRRDRTVYLGVGNHYRLVEYRARRRSVFGSCEECGGRGNRFIGKEAVLGLVLWFIHPRKGASRGVRVEALKEHDVGDVLTMLESAAGRNSARFAGVTGVRVK